MNDLDTITNTTAEILAAEPTQEDLDRCRPWAMCLYDLRHWLGADPSTDDPGDTHLPLGDKLRQLCIKHGVPYPPDDIEHAMLTVAAKWMLQGVPAPVEVNV